MTPTPEQLLASPDYYLHSFEGEDALFAAMDRAAYRRSIFLDRRISPAADGVVRAAIGALGTPSPAAPTGWIFHVAHCGSTLLARALDELGGDELGGDNLVLREPLTLRQLALAPDAARLNLALALLSRRYPGAGATLIKANVPVNFLLDEIAGFAPAAKAIFLHCSLRDYLLAILRSANHRAWLRNVTGQLAAYLGDLSALPDAELGAALWLAMMRRFAAAIEVMPNACSLDAEEFFANPRAVLRAAANHFEMAASEAAIEACVTGPLFSTYSKNPAHAFDNAARLARQAVLSDQLGDELAAAQRWIGKSAPEAEARVASITAAALPS